MRLNKDSMLLIKPLELLFGQLSSALIQLPDDMYKQPVSFLFNASIGQHVRHIIELFQELHAGYDTGLVNYDQRKRDYLLETCLQSALAHSAVIPSLCNREDRCLTVAGNYSAAEENELQVQSSYYRELIYNMEHTVHHMALIRVAIGQITSIKLPEGFGVAVSTQRNQKVCAQ